MNKQSPYRPLAISFAASVLMITAGLLGVEGASPAVAWNRLVMPLLRLCLFIGIGLAAAQIIEARGWSRRIGVLARPLFSFANLGVRCSAAFSTAFFSGVSANAMLVDFHREGKITRQQVFLTNFINQLPAFFLHLPTTFFIVVPLTKTAGLIYFALAFAAVVLRTAGFALYGRFFAGQAAADADTASAGIRVPAGSKEGAWAAVKRRLPGRYAAILTYVLPIYTAVFFLNALGGFRLVRDWLTQILTIRFVPVEALSVVILSFVAEFSSGFAAAGALLEQGVISVEETVLALIAGNIIAFPVRTLRHQLPRYMGIFQPEMGLKILFLGQFFRVASLVLTAGVFSVLA